MTNEELKEKIVDLLVNCKSQECAVEYCATCEGNPYIENCREKEQADALIAAGLIFKKDYRKSRSAELARQERFAAEQGFTPDCSPYYIALQYKQRLSEAEYWKSVYDLALNIAFTGEERAYFCKKAEEELNKKESGEKKEI